MTDEEIFDLADDYGAWQDDFGRWNFQPDRLVSFALEVLRVNAEKPIYVDSSRFPKDQLDHKPGVVITEPVHAIDMSEKHVQISDKNRHEWVGLTEQDVHDAFQFTELIKQLSFDRERPEWCENFAAYLEAKLKEKNT